MLLVFWIQSWMGKHVCLASFNAMWEGSIRFTRSHMCSRTYTCTRISTAQGLRGSAQYFAKASALYLDFCWKWATCSRKGRDWNVASHDINSVYAERTQPWSNGQWWHVLQRGEAKPIRHTKGDQSSPNMLGREGLTILWLYNMPELFIWPQ